MRHIVVCWWNYEVWLNMMSLPSGSGCNDGVFITRRELYDTGRVKLQEQVTVMKDFVRMRTKCTDEYLMAVYKQISFLVSDFKKRWQQARRIEEIFLEKNKDWLDSSVRFRKYDRDATRKCMGRPTKSFHESSDRTKRQKIENLRATYSSDELSFAAEMSLRSSGKKLTKDVVVHQRSTSKDFNNLEKVLITEIVDTSRLSFGFSILHARIECLLHLAYKFPLEKWQARGIEQKNVVSNTKKTIQDRFKKDMGLLVDKPKPGFGNTNDWNTSRTAPRFTQPPIKLSTGSFPGVKGGQSVVPTTPPHSSAEVMESMGLYFDAPQVPSWHKIIHDFNALADWNAQSSHLAGLITVQLISRRRSRKNEDDAEGGRIDDFVVCQKAFLSLHGITKKRLQTIQRSLKFSGLAPTDGRREYGNRPHKLSTEVQKKVHLSKAQTFYQRKTKSKNRCRKSEEVESLVMDYQKKLPTPNISYYKHQLSFYSFNVHQLSDSKPVFYTYTEKKTGKNVANEVISFLVHYCEFELSSNVRHLELFCDCCSGQNKNYAVVRYLHYMVHEEKRFSSIHVTFPIRGPSYMECDKNMGLVNTISKTEIPGTGII
ncbi:hypothetical protein ANN_14515 [Periplaneta americana]|uniref:Uncharacterized protein n=1 Tax=Periplaneta americana TaxID=6978 RepID=A0ABQ8SWH6_PERAM|nr:hypothetical protein ANN_14515 [Periplaneta americana]